MTKLDKTTFLLLLAEFQEKFDCDAAEMTTQETFAGLVSYAEDTGRFASPPVSKFKVGESVCLAGTQHTVTAVMSRTVLLENGQWTIENFLQKM